MKIANYSKTLRQNWNVKLASIRSRVHVKSFDPKLFAQIRVRAARFVRISDT